MQELEIEKRFLVPSDKVAKIKQSIVNNTRVKMRDIYVPNGNAHKDLRLRQKGDKYMITRKRPVKDGESTIMLETTIELSEPEFNALSSGIETNVEKERFLVDILEWRGELDIFKRRHEGLVIVEFEFQNTADLEDFERHAKLDLIDITSIEWLAGGRLAEIDSRELKEKLSVFRQ